MSWAISVHYGVTAAGQVLDCFEHPGELLLRCLYKSKYGSKIHELELTSESTVSRTDIDRKNMTTRQKVIVLLE